MSNVEMKEHVCRDREVAGPIRMANCAHAYIKAQNKYGYLGWTQA